LVYEKRESFQSPFSQQPLGFHLLKVSSLPLFIPAAKHKLSLLVILYMPTVRKLIEIKARTVSMQANYTVPTMEIVADNSTADSKQGEYVIDRDELLHLRSTGLIQPKLFVYLAIKLSYDHLSPSINIPAFCERWGLKEEEFSTALAQLQKKKVLQPVARQLTLQLF